MLSIIPFMMLILFNLLIYCLIKTKTMALPRSCAREKRERHVASILILIILVYSAGHSIITYINMIELWAIIKGSDYKQMWGHDMNIMVSISHLLITFSCSSNFAIYCFKVRILKMLGLFQINATVKLFSWCYFGR